MPEFLHILPKLAIPTASCGETESDPSGTERSSSSGTSHLVRNKMGSVTKKKLRFSKGRCLIHKEALMSSIWECSPQKPGAIRSKVPRALLRAPVVGSPPTVSAPTSPAPTPTKVTKVLAPNTVPHSAAGILRLPLLQRQPTQFILNYRAKRSISEMDIKHSRRTGNFSPPKIEFDTGNNKAPYTVDDDQCAAKEKQAVIISAGMKVMNALVLNAFRKKRTECKRILDENSKLRQWNGNLRLKIRALEELFRIEQKRNQDLNLLVKESSSDAEKAKKACETLTTSLINIKSEKALLENQLRLKEQDYDNLNTILVQTKSQLFKSMTREREIQTSYSSNQRKLLALESQKNDLINEICEINNEGLEREMNMRETIQEQSIQLEQANFKLKKLNGEIEKLKQKEQLLQTYVENETKLKREVNLLQSEVDTLHKCLAASLGSRIKNCWNNSLHCQKTTMQMVHLFAYYMLPATPPPKISKFPFRLAFEKAMNIVKR